MEFSSERKGYNKKEVNKYIEQQKKENEQFLSEQKERINQLKKEIAIANAKLEKYKQKDSHISGALIAAVETAKNIENSSKNIYELEIKRIRALYNKWDSFLSEMMKRYPKLKADFDPKTILKAFDDGIKEVLDKNSVDIEKKSYDYGVGVRNLINKMSNVSTYGRANSTKTKEGPTITRNAKPQSSTMIEKQIEDEYVYEAKRMDKDTIIKPILNIQNDGNDLGGYENIVDKFLDEDITDNSSAAYSNAIIKRKSKESGFDLKAALTPTEDLEDIMKSFTLEDDTKKSKRK